MQKEKIRQKQNGITLIALIITIIVMLILVGVSVTVALNGGLFDQAKNATGKTQLERDREILFSSVMASIGTDARVDLDKLYKNLPDGFTVSDGKYISENGNIFIVDENGNITLEDKEGDSAGGTEENITIDATTAGIIFKKGGETEVTGDDLANVQLEEGDTVQYGDYIYTYGTTYVGQDYIGWSAKVVDNTKSSYEPLASTIFSQDLISMTDTFSDCTSLVTPPSIPNGVLTLGYSGMGYSGAFSGCASLTSAPEIPESVLVMDAAFADCTALETAPIIPQNVIGFKNTFNNCTSLTGELIINGVSRVEDYYGQLSMTHCLNETTQPIHLTGDSACLVEIYSTANNRNVTIDNSIILSNAEYFYVDDNMVMTSSYLNWVLQYFSGLDLELIISGYSGTLSNLTVNNINRPNSLSVKMEEIQNIQSQAFINCTALTKIELPSTLTSIESEVFYGCSNLTDIYVPGFSEQPSTWDADWLSEAPDNVNVHWGVAMP